MLTEKQIATGKTNNTQADKIITESRERGFCIFQGNDRDLLILLSRYAMLTNSRLIRLDHLTVTQVNYADDIRLGRYLLLDKVSYNTVLPSWYETGSI
jgi:hypothetical protein